MNNIPEITNRYVLPTIEEKTAYGFKRLDPYTKLFEERIIFLGQPIDDTCCKRCHGSTIDSRIHGSRS